MTLNNSEFDDVREDFDADEPLDGRDSQPVTEGSSDVPSTLDSEDPLRGTDAILSTDTELGDLAASELEPSDEERLVEDPLLDEDIDPGIDAEPSSTMGDLREDPDQV